MSRHGNDRLRGNRAAKPARKGGGNGDGDARFCGRTADRHGAIIPRDPYFWRRDPATGELVTDHRSVCPSWAGADVDDEGVVVATGPDAGGGGRQGGTWPPRFSDS